MTTMTTLMYPLLQDPQARCNVPLLHVYVQVYSLAWACLCLKFYLVFYFVILWSNFIPVKINNAMNNIYKLVLIICAILSLNSWPLIPLTTIPKSEKFRFQKRVWSQGFRIRDCVPVFNSMFICYFFNWNASYKRFYGRNAFMRARIHTHCFITIVTVHDLECRVILNCLIFQVLTAASMKIRVFRDVAPCSDEVDRRFRGAYCFCQGDDSTSTWLHGATSQETNPNIELYFVVSPRGKGWETLDQRDTQTRQTRNISCYRFCFVFSSYCYVALDEEVVTKDVRSCCRQAGWEACSCSCPSKYCSMVLIHSLLLCV
jgi:hypothetical protein